MNEKRKKIVILTVCAITLMLASILGTYAYFVSSINNDNRQEADVDTGTMRLRFADNDEGINAKLMLGESITKKFTLENTGTLDAKVSIEWLDMINTYTEGSLTYTLSYSETEDGEYTELVSSTNVPTSSTEFTSTLVPDITIPVGVTYYYNLVVTLNNLSDVDQTEDLNASFSTKFIVNQPSTNRKYTLTIDPNGGTIDGSSEIQTLNMNVGDTYELGTNDTTGYRKFEGWTISGYDSSIKDTTVTIGKSNVKVIAKYGNFKIQDAIKDIENGEIPKYVNTTKPNFLAPATTDEGIFALEDDYGTSYYYRGAAENNYVKFGDFYWRIIRINGDGSLKIIYDGTYGHENGDASSDKVISISTNWNSFGDDAKYVGWMFGGTQGQASASKEQAQINETSSDLKTLVDAWYKTNIVDNNLSDKIADTIFCNDRSTASENEAWWHKDTKKGFGKNPTAYGFYGRYAGDIAGTSWNSNATPLLKCPQKNDAFTVNDEKLGNGDLTYPVGLITFDEVLAVGSGLDNENINYFLYNSEFEQWTMTPTVMDTTLIAFVASITKNGPYNISNVLKKLSVKPVINLDKKYVKTMIGDGTINNPYRDINDIL